MLKQIFVKIIRLTKPAEFYFRPKHSIEPLSSHFGFDRGTPIDRVWIEDFLNKNRKLIRGRCLEITDDFYTKKFRGDKVSESDVLDIDRKNKKANIYGDLRNLKGVIKDNTYDCVILTHVLGLIDDLDSAVNELKRILKPGGVVLVTSACISPTYNLETNFWRIMPQGARYLFGKHFGKENVKVGSYGNVLAGQSFWVGMAQEELTKKELMYNDPHFPCIVTICATKQK